MRDGNEPVTAGRRRWWRSVGDAVAGWTRLARRFNRLVIIVALIASVAALHHTITHLGINTSTLDMLDEDLSFRRDFDRLDAAFPQDHRILIVVVDADAPHHATEAATRLAAALEERSNAVTSVFFPEAEPFFRRNALLYLSVDELRALADRLAEAQPMLAALARDPSLRGIADLLTLALSHADEAEDDGMPPALEDALNRIATVIEETASGSTQSLSWRALLEPGDGTDDERGRKIIIVEPTLDFTSLEPAAAAVADIRSVIADLGLSAENGVSVRLTGEVLMLQEELETVRSDVGLVGLASFLLVLVLLSIGLSSWRLFAATTVTLVVGLIMTGWLATVIIGHLNLVSVSFAVLFIGLSVDFGIHYSLRCRELLSRRVASGLAIDEAASAVAAGLILSALSAAIGFLSFVPTDFKGLAELGIIAAMGMGVALFCNLTLLPALIALRPPRTLGEPMRVGWFQRLQSAPERQPRAVVAVSVLVGLAAVALLPMARFNDSALDLRDADREAVATLLTLLDDPRVDPFRALVIANDGDEAMALKRRLEALPEVRSVVLPSDLVPDDQEAKLAVIDEMALFLSPLLMASGDAAPAEAEDLAASLAAMRAAAQSAAEATGSPGARRLASAVGERPMSANDLTTLQTALVGDFPSVLRDLTDALDAAPFTVADLPAHLRKQRLTDDGRVLVEVFAAKDQRIKVHRTAFADAVTTVAPHASGESIMLTESGRAVVRSFLEAGAYASVLIVVLLLLVLRSVVDTAVVIVPLVLAGLLTVATGVLAGIPFNFANVIVLPLLFGLGVAGGIHMLMRMRDSTALSLQETSTPRAVLFSALTTVGSFGSLAISSHPGLASMGQLLTIAIVFTTVCTIGVLPALRWWVGHRSTAAARRSAAKG